MVLHRVVPKTQVKVGPRVGRKGDGTLTKTGMHCYSDSLRKPQNIASDN